MRHDRKALAALYPDWHATLSEEEWAAWDRMAWWEVPPNPPYTDDEKRLYLDVIGRVAVDVGGERAVGCFRDLGCSWWYVHDPERYQACHDAIAADTPTECGILLINLLKLYALYTKLAESMKQRTSLEPLETSRLWLDFDELRLDLTRYPINLMARASFNDSRFVSEFMKLTGRKIVFSEDACRDLLKAIRNHATNKIFFDKKLTRVILAPLRGNPSEAYLAEIAATRDWFNSGDAFLHRGDYWGQSRIHLRDAVNKAL